MIRKLTKCRIVTVSKVDCMWITSETRRGEESYSHTVQFRQGHYPYLVYGPFLIRYLHLDSILDCNYEKHFHWISLCLITNQIIGCLVWLSGSRDVLANHVIDRKVIDSFPYFRFKMSRFAIFNFGVKIRV